MQCKESIAEFIDNFDTTEIDDLYGFSAESTWSKKDDLGKRSVYRIVYHAPSSFVDE